jgi:predicted nucleic acid-binding protein
LLVAALTREAATERIQTWLTRQEPDTLLISDWVVTEFASALSIKVRMELLDIRDRARVAGLFTRLRAESLTVVPVSREHFLTAARFADQYCTDLRAGGALHVAIAAAQGATICTLDKRLADAATSLAVSADLV